MKRTTLIVTAGLMLLAFLVIGCSGDEKIDKGTLAQKMMDTVASAVATDLANKIVEPADKPIELEEKIKNEAIVSYGQFEIFDNQLVSISDDGLVVYNFKQKSSETIECDDNFYCMVVFEDKLYLGGDALYELKDGQLEFVDDEFVGIITDLYGYEMNLMIGTEFGLYTRGPLGKSKIMDEVCVTAMASDGNGLWVGTDGEGLYRWDGENFKKRFIKRDPTFFDTVLTLTFNHKHLYMGTVNGFHIYDGGSWKTITEEDGLPNNHVNSIDATNWVVYVGTDQGVMSYFEDEPTLVDNFEMAQINDINVKRGQIYVSTEYSGLLVKTGDIVKTMLQPVIKAEIQYLSLIY